MKINFPNNGERNDSNKSTTIDSLTNVHFVSADCAPYEKYPFPGAVEYINPFSTAACHCQTSFQNLRRLRKLAFSSPG